MNEQIQLYLASRSPRRHQLLSQLGIRFTVLDVDIDESCKPGEDPLNYVKRLALEKARAGFDMPKRTLELPVMGADTTVVVDGVCLGKPIDRAEAVLMLKRLSARVHQVFTAVSCVSTQSEATIVSQTHVRFSTLSSSCIDAYLNTGEFQDKAGAYAIQGIAGQFIPSIEGSYTGVVGLPLYETSQLCAQFSIKTSGV